MAWGRPSGRHVTASEYLRCAGLRAPSRSECWLASLTVLLVQRTHWQQLTSISSSCAWAHDFRYPKPEAGSSGSAAGFRWRLFDCLHSPLRQLCRQSLPALAGQGGTSGGNVSSYYPGQLLDPRKNIDIRIQSAQHTTCTPVPRTLKAAIDRHWTVDQSWR